MARFAADTLPLPIAEDLDALVVAGGMSLVKCRRCGESATVRREFLSEMEAWFATSHRCGTGAA